MATVADTIWIALGLKSDDLNKGLSKAEGDIKKAAASLSQGVNQVSAKAVSQIAGIARMVAAPLAGAMSIGAMIKSYFGGVAQVAQMTGAYSTKLEEWRKKRAMLNRVTREDIDLYKKSREALTKFQITMGDLSAKIMRQTSPAVKKLVEWLNKLSDWLDKYSDDIVRFLQVCAAVIGTALVPNLLKMAKALLMNPITWVVAGLVALALAIDDLIVWLKGGDSALDSFWSKFGDRKEVMAKLQKIFKTTKEIFSNFVESLKNGIKSAIQWLSDFWTSTNGTAKVLNTLKSAWQILLDVFKTVKIVWDTLVGALTKTNFLDSLKQALQGVINLLGGLVDIVLGLAQVITSAVRGLFSGDWTGLKEGLSKLGSGISNILNGIIKIAGAAIEQIVGLAILAFKNLGQRLFEFLNIRGLIQSAIDIWNSFIGKIESAYQKITSWFNDIGKAIKTYFSDKIDALKTTWENFCNSLQSWYNRIMGWFADIGKAIADAFSFDNITKKLDGVMAKLNPANWFKSDDAETAEAGEGPKKKGWLDGVFNWADKTKENQTAELAQISKDNEVAQNAEYSTVSNNSSSSTAVYNQQRIELNNATPQAVERAFEMTGMDQSQYSQYTLQSASPIG